MMLTKDVTNVDNANISFYNKNVVRKKTQATKYFKPSINRNSIKQTYNLRYFGVYLDNELLWKSHFNVVLYFQNLRNIL